MKAYDISMLTEPAKRDADCQGWCFGLPPGISAEQWPLDLANGYPLMHGFTLLLPPDYRVHGPNIAALSFFALAPDHNDGGPALVPSIASIFDQPDNQPPADARLLPFWQAARREDPHMFRISDLLGGGYAVRLLTQAEYEGPLCQPPTICGKGGSSHPFRSQVPPPQWMLSGSAHAYWSFETSIGLGLEPEQYALYRALGEIPTADPAFNRALRWSPRKQDPNAGIPPREYDPAGGYQKPYYWLNDEPLDENYREHEWAKDHSGYHIGGTMGPIQAMPEFSPFYVEFDEAMGGYNFGGGNAQLDFKDMQFDWAC